jgi:pimeloyl-ACP methyl ester carboxylesterase
MDDGAVIYVRQHGRPDGPRLVLSHGNGLAINGYLPFWRPLCERYEVVLFDFRNHGINPPHGASGHDLHTFAHDMERVFHSIQANLGLKPTAGVFHSLSAITAIRHTLEMGRRWDALVLFDPPLFPREGHLLQPLQQADKDELSSRARRRTPRYKDPSDLARQFASVPTFSKWVPEAYELMARATLRRDDTAGDWILACPRELEASIFAANGDPTLWPRMARFAAPIKLVCADPDIEDARAPALVGQALAAELSIEYEAIPHTTHFLQIERPAECIRATESFLAEYELSAPPSAS